MHLYQREAELTDAVVAYSLDVLEYEGQGLIFFATRRHCESFRRALMLHEFDVGGALSRHQIRFLHVEDVLPQIMQVGSVDATKLGQLVRSEIHRMQNAGGVRHVHIYGEIVDVLWRLGNHAATLRLEQLWNALRSSEDLTLYCAYSVQTTPAEAITGPLHAAIHTHNALMQEVPLNGIRQRRVFSDLGALSRREATPIEPGAGMGAPALSRPST